MECIESFVKRDLPYVIPETSIEEASQIFKIKKVSQLSILDNEEHRYPVGILSEHGLMGRCLELKRSLANIHVKECMQEVPLLLNSEMGPEHCYMVMSQHNVNQAPVVDEHNKYIGEINIEDLQIDD